MTKPVRNANTKSRLSDPRLEMFLASFNPATKPTAIRAILVFANRICQIDCLRGAASMEVSEGGKTFVGEPLAVVLAISANPMNIAIHTTSNPIPSPRGGKSPRLNPMANKSIGQQRKVKTEAIF